MIEAMATVVVLGTIGSISAFLVLEAADDFTVAVTTEMLNGELSITLDRVTRELRRIELDSADPGVAPNIALVNSGAIDWNDSDSDLYQLLWDNANSELELAIDGGSLSVIQEDVTNCVITIYDEDNTQLAATCSGDGCDPVRRIKVEVTCQRTGVTVTQHTKVYLRSAMVGAQ